jgi:lipopolysaccharide biosynthesis glycosyltransferase
MESEVPLKVATGIDDNYVLPFLVMVFSAKINTTEKIHVTLGFDSNELSASNQELLFRVLRIIDVSFNFVEVSLSKSMEARAHISSTSYSRLLLADKLSGLMLWLDSDLICLPGWDSIFLDKGNLPNGMVMSVVRDELLSNQGAKYASRSSNESLKIMGSDYYNTGVALIDCDMWKALNYPQKWPKLLEEAKVRGFQYADQCVLNFLCQRQVNYLPWAYNALASAKNHGRNSSPFILHFAGGIKPWFYSIKDPRILAGRLFSRDVFKYLRYQSQLIEIVKTENPVLGSILSQERKRIRRFFRESRILGVAKRTIRFLTSKDKVQKIKQKLSLE